MLFNSKIIKKILFSFVLFGEIRYSFQIDQSIFGKILNNNQNALKCFNKQSDGIDCSRVQSYINIIKYLYLKNIYHLYLYYYKFFL